MTHTPTPRAHGALILAAALALSGAGFTTVARADDGSPPSVARISATEGDVGVKQGDSDQVAAGINAPLEAGDYLSTGNDGRVEVQLDPGNVVRAGSDTQIRFTQLDGSQDTVQLAQGTVEVRVLQADDDHVSVQTPSVDVVPDEAGAYLVTVDTDGQTFVTARSGSLDVTTPQGSQTLDPGRTMQVSGSANDPQYQFVDEVAATDLDQWGTDRDAQLTVASSDQYVNPDMLGASDLDAYGTWNNVSGYGEVWQPNDVPANWSPYSDGNWAYQNYYGWTWVAAEPWGWAPYHYGRWAYMGGNGWGWVPGPVDVAPVYSPALVAFFGFGGGGGIGIGFNFGNVGWVPLAPGDPYHPWWGSNNTTIVVNNTTIINNYRNINHGLVGLPVVGWQHGNFNQIQRLHATQFRDMHSVVGRLPLAPTRENYRFTTHPVGTTVAKPIYRSFESIHPIGASPSGPVRTAPRAYTGAQRATGSTGWQRFETTRTMPQRATMPTTSRQGFTSAGGSRGAAWQHFGSAPRTASSYQRPVYQPQRSTYQQPQRPTYQQSPYQRPTYQRQGYTPPQQTYARPTYQQQQSPYQRPTYQRQGYTPPQQTYARPMYQQRQQSPYQRPSYPQPQRPSYQSQPSYQRPQASYQRPSYQRDTYQRPSGASSSRAPSPRGSPYPHGPKTM